MKINWLYEYEILKKISEKKLDCSVQFDEKRVQIQESVLNLQRFQTLLNDFSTEPINSWYCGQVRNCSLAQLKDVLRLYQKQQYQSTNKTVLLLLQLYVADHLRTCLESFFMALLKTR